MSLAPEQLQLLDVELRVECNDLELRAALRQVYGGCQAPAASGAQLTLRLERTATGARLCGPDGVFQAPRGAEASLLLALLAPVLKRVRAYFVLHAGVLRTGAGTALLLAAPSGVGKTTLTLALVEAGWGFYSDELAPLERERLRVAPFPRAVGVREPASALFPRLWALPAPITREPDGTAKKLLDMAARVPRPARPLEVSHVLLLTPQQQPSQPRRRWLELTLSAAPAGLDSALAALPGVEELVWLERRGAPRLRLGLTPGARLAGTLERLLGERGVLLTRLVPAATTRPDYGTEPTLEPLPASQGVLELAAHLQNGMQSELLGDEYDHSLARLLFELGGLGSRARFARLVVGRLDRMRERVCEFVEEAV